MNNLNSSNASLWYKDAIIYELHVKAFNDKNADGIGDFKGLMEKLDYLQDLGVTAIWLLPFYPSPQKDDGYDIADYYSINPAYGSLNDFKKFVKEAHKRGLKVITELVINHTSDQHPWFQRARKAKAGSDHRDYYVWTDDPNKYKGVRIIFQDFEASNWTWDPEAKAYYWHRFFSHQPDLNFDNPKVQQEVFRMLDFWMNMGVDGFRLDAVPYLFEREGTNCENLPETHAFLKKLRSHVDKHYKNRLLLAEANMWPEDSAAYFGNGDECHMNYHFPIMPRLFMALKMEDRYPIIDILDQTPEIPENCQWAMFLRNHDELTLEMVTDEERDYMYKVYTKDPQARINLGIRHRLAPLLENNRNKIELMNVLLFSLPGTPVLYYGDEIGMGDNYYLGDRNGVRTPMQWTSDRNASFSKANPQQLYLPVILDPEYSYEAVNVETQQKNPNSLLWWMKRIINMRKHHKSFSRGSIKFLPSENNKVISFIRSYEDEHVLVIVNLSRYAEPLHLDLKDFKGYVPEEIFSHNRFPKIKDEPYQITLSPYGYFWFLLKPTETEKTEGEAPGIQLREWKDISKEEKIVQLEDDILPHYLSKSRWFGGKARGIDRITVAKIIPHQAENQMIYWLILEVSYYRGLPEFYQLPLAHAMGEWAEKISGDNPNAIIAPVTINDRKGVLLDAVYSNDFRCSLIELISKRRKPRPLATGIAAYSKKEVSQFLKENKVSSKILNAEQSNTSITYNDKFFLKLYRKLDNTINPDLEITRFITEEKKFSHVPKFLGAIEDHSGNQRSPVVLGMLSRMMANQGDAWSYITDTLKRFYEKVLTHERVKKLPPLKGKLHDPVSYEKMPDILKEMIESDYAERISLLGKRTAEMHLALASGNGNPDFHPEEFSLHYQRSVFSSFQSLVRSTYENLEANLERLPENLQQDAADMLDKKPEVLQFFKKIFSRKIDTIKIRNHGDYHLGQVLFTGKDFVIIDFEGEPARSFSERRLKRSALRDVAGMVRSFHYAAYSGLLQNERLREEDRQYLEQWADQWYHYISGFFIRSYIETIGDSPLLPSNKKDFEILLQTFLLEKAIYEVNYELNNRPGWVLIPLRGFQQIMH